MAADGAGFVPKVELSAYERERPVLDEHLLEVRRVRFYAAGHRWPLVLGDDEIAVALHLAVAELTADPDELAEVAFWSVQYASLDHIAALARETRAFLVHCAVGAVPEPERGRFLRRWHSAERYRACVQAATMLCTHAPRSPRTLPAADGPAPWQVA
ncbi:hypothetical protein ABZX92_05790 [Lentzea sp. NPDC006480]|uniref:hypothetical protein n=1 Tax=Lentzea sp. NPDC006480 TaxID=3157176 RepID=UPI0033A4A44C